MTSRQGCPSSVSSLLERIRPFRGYLGARIASRQRSRCPGRLPALREDRGVVYADQRSSNQCRGCLRGFTIAGVQLYGKGRAGVGLASAVWVTGTELAHSAVAGYRLQLRHATPFTI